jgi:hypothetical protein
VCLAEAAGAPQAALERGRVVEVGGVEDLHNTIVRGVARNGGGPAWSAATKGATGRRGVASGQ